MKNYKITVRYRGTDDDEAQESTPWFACSPGDLEFFLHINREVAEKKHGKDNVLSVTAEEGS
jgi:hypothetical protein